MRRMIDQRGWLALIVLALVAVGVYWFVAERSPMQSSGETATLAKPAIGSSVAAPSSSNANRKTEKATTSQRQEDSHPSIDGTVAVPPRFRLPGVDRVQVGDSFEEWLSHYSLAQQKQIRAFNKRHHGVYQVHSAQTVAWMAKNGYPMPEDLLAAEMLSTEQLRQLAEHGNAKAGFLLRDRQLEVLERKYAEYAAQGKNSGQVLVDNPQFWKDETMLNRLFAESNSPYKAFLEARAAGVKGGDPDSVDAMVIGALRWAHSLGDLRAPGLIKEFMQSDPSRGEIRRTLNSGSLATAVYLGRTISKMRRAGCPSVGAAPGYNPTALPHRPHR